MGPHQSVQAAGHPGLQGGRPHVRGMPFAPNADVDGPPRRWRPGYSRSATER
ncbi:hypothetical protein RC1_0427 [Rhodospirillum centenum SW]|uniref:Uncharacterized protein n=1 Tax=Rhodospirillum centenum (strain ATCC 51521 / SW) TaxID=414684 RepID=B6IQY0_RHOCS|nr:hypothetical protein RC1_0427 [Rhodospirillum centenum SW]